MPNQLTRNAIALSHTTSARRAAIGVACFAATAVLVSYLARRAERRHRPLGKFLTVSGNPIHYTDRGRGRPVIILHGNGSMVEELEASQLPDGLAADYRVITIDRPGFGNTPRPDRQWSPEREATLVLEIIRQLGLERPVIVAHSWATLVALSIAIREPEMLSGLVLIGGYYYPTWRADVAVQSIVAAPVIGGLLRHTVWPLAARAATPFMFRHLFFPSRPSAKFLSSYSISMAARPSQLTAVADDTVDMPQAASRLSAHYGEIELPVDIIAGSDDKVVSTKGQSRRLNRELRDSYLDEVPGQGHMVHHAHPQLVQRRVAHVFERAVNRTEMEQPAR
jgi:pimeloyl-ACP methyl ester carboxylesterase